MSQIHYRSDYLELKSSNKLYRYRPKLVFLVVLSFITAAVKMSLICRMKKIFLLLLVAYEMYLRGFYSCRTISSLIIFLMLFDSENITEYSNENFPTPRDAIIHLHRAYFRIRIVVLEHQYSKHLSLLSLSLSPPPFVMS